MKIFCVPTHKSICPTPLSEQGVLLVPDMLTKGIWFPVGGSTVEEDFVYHKVYQLRRSENEPEYLAALKALSFVRADDARFTAVVSLRWCSLTYRLITPGRVWLSIYRGRKNVATYSHRANGEPTRNFASCWPDIETDEGVWRNRFSNATSADQNK